MVPIPRHILGYKISLKSALKLIWIWWTIHCSLRTCPKVIDLDVLPEGAVKVCCTHISGVLCTCDVSHSFIRNTALVYISVKLKTVDFLDVQFDLPTNRYFPFKKPNDTPMYVHKHSNHPKNILKEIPKMTARRLSNLSCSEEEFKKVSPEYESVLRASGYDEMLSYIPDKPKRKNRRKKSHTLILLLTYR